jgi:hypothetical protein
MIEELLQKLRDFTTDNLRNGNIEQRSNFLYIPNDWQSGVSETLNKDRLQVIDTMNNILERHNVEKIPTRLKQ